MMSTGCVQCALEGTLCYECDSDTILTPLRDGCMFPLDDCESTPEDYEIRWHHGTPYFFCPECDEGYFWDSKTLKCQPCDYFVEDCLSCNNDDVIIACDECDTIKVGNEDIDLFVAPGG